MVNVNEVVFKSIKVETEEGIVTLRTGDKISFISENTGEEIKGVLLDIKGSKPEKTKIVIKPDKEECEATYDVIMMAENSLKLINE